MTYVALVTGAGRGLGAALAGALARDGFAVAVHYRTSRAGALAVCRSIQALGGETKAFHADLSRESEALNLAEKVSERFGGLDLLINNAGIYREVQGMELSEVQWFEGLDSTASQVFFTTRACLPLLRQGRLRRIINIGDSSGDRLGARDLAWSYHIGKSGVWTLTRSFAAAEAPNGVAVNMVSPGYLENSVDRPDPATIPAGRLGTFEDVYGVVRFLALDAPAYLSGSNLMVSGGWNLR
jgi:NAD(P)-dependent dehydrogenase (short-subunit alcohol dehydrogenase family)